MALASIDSSSEFGTYLTKQVTNKLENFASDIVSVFSSGDGDGKDIAKLALSSVGENEYDGSADKYTSCGNSSAEPWCGGFVQTKLQDFIRMGGKLKSWVMNIVDNMRYCPNIQNAAQSANAIVNNNAAKAGDVVLFDWDGDGEADHTGLVVNNSNGVIETVEGNSSNQVQHNSYNVSDGRLMICTSV